MIISRNKKVSYEYHILDEYVAGIVLLGSEVKSISNHKVSLNEAYCYINDGEIFIKNMHISTCESANKYDMHDPIRARKLLLNKKEITTLNTIQDLVKQHSNDAELGNIVRKIYG